MGNWLKVKEAAAMLNCSKSQVLRLCAIGKLRCINVGSRERTSYRIDPCLEMLEVTKPPVTREPAFAGTPFTDMFRRKR